MLHCHFFIAEASVVVVSNERWGPPPHAERKRTHTQKRAAAAAAAAAGPVSATSSAPGVKCRTFSQVQYFCSRPSLRSFFFFFFFIFNDVPPLSLAISLFCRPTRKKEVTTVCLCVGSMPPDLIQSSSRRVHTTNVD